MHKCLLNVDHSLSAALEKSHRPHCAQAARISWQSDDNVDGIDEANASCGLSNDEAEALTPVAEALRHRAEALTPVAETLTAVRDLTPNFEWATTLSDQQQQRIESEARRDASKAHRMRQAAALLASIDKGVDFEDSHEVGYGGKTPTSPRTTLGGKTPTSPRTTLAFSQRGEGYGKKLTGKKVNLQNC